MMYFSLKKNKYLVTECTYCTSNHLYLKNIKIKLHYFRQGALGCIEVTRYVRRQNLGEKGSRQEPQNFFENIGFKEGE